MKKPEVWKQKVSDSICPKLSTICAIAEAARVQASNSTVAADTPCPYRLALRTALLCISDCERYIEAFDRARAASELALCLYPCDASAHGKLGLLAWKSTDSLSRNNLLAMHHFCFELANSPPVVLVDTLKISRFVAHVRDEFCLATPKSSRAKSAKFQFTCAFIDASWSLLVDEDLLAVAGKVAPSCTIWWKLRECLDAELDHMDHMDDGDLKHILGICMYSRHRVSPHGNASLRQEPKRAQIADEFIARLFLVICERLEVDMENVRRAVLNRKKNRTRFAQKKRKAAAALSGTAPILTDTCADVSQIVRGDVGLDYFDEAHRKVRHERLLSFCSFLAHFWSKSITLSRDCRLHLYRDVMDAVARICLLIEKFVGTAGLTGLLAQVTTTVMDAKRDSQPLGAKLPALDEDVMFSAFDPCIRREMFRRITIPLARSEHVLLRSDALSVSDTMGKMAVSGHLSLLRQTAVNHSEAFAKRMFTSAFPGRNATAWSRISALKALVELGLRKQRFQRIRSSIQSYAGGRIGRLEKPSQENETVNGSQLCNFAQPGNAGSLPAEADIHADESVPRQPNYKRRRMAAAKSQKHSHSIDADDVNDLFTLTKPSNYRRRSPGQAQQADESRPQSPDADAGPISPTTMRNGAFETPRVFGQPVQQHLTPETPVVPVPVAQEATSTPRTMFDAVDVVFYTNPNGRNEKYRWWPFVLNADAAHGNPFFLDKFRSEREHRQAIHEHWSALFK